METWVGTLPGPGDPPRSPSTRGASPGLKGNVVGVTNGMDVKTKMKRSCESRAMRPPRRMFHCPRKEGRPTSLQLADSRGPQALLEDQ